MVSRSRNLSVMYVPWYIGTMKPDEKFLVERVQTGVRMEKRLLKVLKAFGEYHDMTLGDLMEGIVLHAFDGKTPFGQASLDQIRELKKFYGLELDSTRQSPPEGDEARAIVPQTRLLIFLTEITLCWSIRRKSS